MASGAFSADSVALKGEHLHSDWVGMFAGGDVGLVPSLMDRIRIEVNQLGKWIQPLSIDSVAQAVAIGFQKERRARAADLFLSPYGIDLPQFLSNGIHLFGDATAAVIRDRIEQYRLDCELLVFGHANAAKHRRAHIFSAEDPGIIKRHSVQMRVVRPEYLVALWLQPGGASTLRRRERAAKLRESVEFNAELLADLKARYNF